MPVHRISDIRRGGRVGRTHHLKTEGNAMNTSVQAALENARQKLAAQEAAQREELALYFDLYTRDYAPDGTLSEEYCYYDSQDEPKRYFRKVAIPLSDEEMAQLMQMRAQLEASAPKVQAAQRDATEHRKSIFGQVLYVAGSLGLILTVGLYIATRFSSDLYAFGFMEGLWTYMLGACVSLIFMGLGKGLMLLTDIANRTRSLDA